MGEVHRRFKDENDLLVVILTDRPMIQKRARTYIMEALFLLIALFFAGGYIYLSFAQANREENEQNL